jgi:hypothetical protein
LAIAAGEIKMGSEEGSEPSRRLVEASTVATERRILGLNQILE